MFSLSFTMVYRAKVPEHSEMGFIEDIRSGLMQSGRK